MHYSIDCYVAKALPVHRPFMDIMVAEKNFSWGSTAQQSHLSYQHTATLVVAVIG